MIWSVLPTVNWINSIEKSKNSKIRPINWKKIVFVMNKSTNTPLNNWKLSFSRINNRASASNKEKMLSEASKMSSTRPYFNGMLWKMTTQLIMLNTNCSTHKSMLCSFKSLIAKKSTQKCRDKSKTIYCSTKKPEACWTAKLP